MYYALNGTVLDSIPQEDLSLMKDFLVIPSSRTMAK